MNPDSLKTAESNDFQAQANSPESKRKLPVKQIIFSLQLFLLLAALDQTVVTTAMPKIIEQLGGFERYSWATTSYLFSSTIAVPVAGKLSDVYGRKASLLCSALLFVLASVACGTATTFAGCPVDGMNQLIIYRVIQGIGGGAIVSLAFSVVGDLFAPAERGKYQGYFAAVFALSSIIGPALGGYVADVSSWRWLFYINVPVGLIAAIVFNGCFEDKVIHRSNERFDTTGLILFCISTACLLAGLSLPFSDHIPIVNLVFLGLFMVSSIVFIRLEKDAQSPFLPVKLFQNKIILISIASLSVYGIGMFGGSLLVPLYMQTVRAMSVSASGIALSPLILTVAISSIVGGQWMSKSGKYKSIVLTGLSLMTIGTFTLALMPQDTPVPMLVAAMALVGLGIGILLPIYTIVIQNAVSDDLTGTVTGLSQFSRSIGGTLGVACLGSLLIIFYHSNLQKISARKLPPQMVAILDNPLEPKKLRSSIRELAPGDTQLVEEMLSNVQKALYRSIQLIYLLYGAALAGTVLLNLLLEELPLRSTTTETSPEKLE